MTQPNPNPIVFIGTYTQTTAYPVCRVFGLLSESRHSGGIYVCRFDGESGGLEPLSVVSGAENPSFLALHPNGSFLYAASEAQEFEGKRQGALYAYAIDAEAGRLEFINSIGSGGQGPCHVRVDATGRFLLAANYHGGSVCVAPIGDDGGLEPLSCFIQHEGASGVNPARQDRAHAHSINPDASKPLRIRSRLGTGPHHHLPAGRREWDALRPPTCPTWKPNPARDRATSRSTLTVAAHTRSTSWAVR